MSTDLLRHAFNGFVIFLKKKIQHSMVPNGWPLFSKWVGPTRVLNVFEVLSYSRRIFYHHNL